MPKTLAEDGGYGFLHQYHPIYDPGEVLDTAEEFYLVFCQDKGVKKLTEDEAVHAAKVWAERHPDMRFVVMRSTKAFMAKRPLPISEQTLGSK
jgi:hypothetical protein